MNSVHRALFVMTSKDRLTLKDGSQHPTGFWASEFVEPYDAFKQAGMAIDVATEDGRPPVVDSSSVDPAQVGADDARRFTDEIRGAAELAHPRTLREVKASDYDLIFVPGGHAPVEDLPTDPDVSHLLFQAHAAGTLVAALCHGPAALLAATSPQGKWLYAGQQLTGFSQAEEDLTPVAGRMRWELEPALRDRGGLYSKSAASTPFEGYVIHDGSLITGENPASAELIAPKVLQVLHSASPAGQSVTFSVQRDVAASPDAVWAVIGRFDAMPWHPGLESGTVATKDGVTTRRLTAKGGGPVFVEQLVESAPHMMRYRMLEGLPLHPEATLRVDPDGRGGSRVTWEADMDTSSADAATARGVTQGVTGFYEAGLTALQGRFGKG